MKSLNEKAMFEVFSNLRKYATTQADKSLANCKDSPLLAKAKVIHRKAVSMLGGFTPQELIEATYLNKINYVSGLSPEFTQVFNTIRACNTQNPYYRRSAVDEELRSFFQDALVNVLSKQARNCIPHFMYCLYDGILMNVEPDEKVRMAVHKYMYFKFLKSVVVESYSSAQHRKELIAQHAHSATRFDTLVVPSNKFYRVDKDNIKFTRILSPVDTHPTPYRVIRSVYTNQAWAVSPYWGSLTAEKGLYNGPDVYMLGQSITNLMPNSESVVCDIKYYACRSCWLVNSKPHGGYWSVPTGHPSMFVALVNTKGRPHLAAFSHSHLCAVAKHLEGLKLSFDDMKAVVFNSPHLTMDAPVLTIFHKATPVALIRSVPLYVNYMA